MLILSHFIYLSIFCTGCVLPGSANFDFLKQQHKKKRLAVFRLNEEGPKLLCGLGSDYRRGRPFQCGMVRVNFEMDSSNITISLVSTVFDTM